MKKTHDTSMNVHMFLQTLQETFYKLLPQFQFYKPAMFVTYIGAIFTTLYVIVSTFHHTFSWFELQIALWLWFTVLFANFAEALAESRGKAHADSLKKVKVNTFAKQLEDGLEIKKAACDLRKGDLVICEAGDTIPADGEVIEGIASVDESAITGESAPVIRECGGDRSAVTVGTRLLSDRIVMRVTSEPGTSFLDRIITLIEGSQRQKTPNEIALSVLLSGLTFIFLLTVISLKFFADYSIVAADKIQHQTVSIPILIALLVCLIPTTISALLTAVGIAGIDRLTRFNVIAKSGRAVEAAGDIDLLIVDKTGTITLGNRIADEFIPFNGLSDKYLAEVAQLASLSDETPEGRSIVVLAKSRYGLRGENISSSNTHFYPFSAKSRMSGVDMLDNEGKVVRVIRKGSPDAIKNFIECNGGKYPVEFDNVIQNIAKQGGTPLLVGENNKLIGAVFLKDMIKGGIKHRFIEFRKGGIRTMMITGDNPLTAAAIAAEAGIDDFVAEATPEDKLKIIRKEQKEGHLVAMTGDGTNDAPALAQADVGVAMNSGTAATREAGNMVDLDNNPLKLIDVVRIGKQMLITRGALTTFSICNDVAKYFAIIPALFSQLYLYENYSYGPLKALGIMHLHSPQSAILSAVIFNALIIVLLIPLALRGVNFKVQQASALLQRNLFIYGIGGILIPFIGIKLIDMLIVALGLV